MDDAVNRALRKVVDQSESPDELARRVVQSFGEGLLPQARQLAAETKGLNWLRQGRQPTPQQVASNLPSQALSFSAVLNVVLRTPSLLMGTLGAAAILVVLAFPPFIVPLPGGFENNAGFAFILAPPIAGESIRAIVNVPLLAVLVAGIGVATGIAVMVARRAELMLSLEAKA